MFAGMQQHLATGSALPLNAVPALQMLEICFVLFMWLPPLLG